jgi:hypothetical protein
MHSADTNISTIAKLVAIRLIVVLLFDGVGFSSTQYRPRR